MESTETQIKTIETQIKKGRGRPPLSEEEKQRRLANKNPKVGPGSMIYQTMKKN